MGTLIITVLLGLMFAYFATLNTQTVSINIGSNLLSAPLYILVIVSVLIGLLISAIISAIDSISASFALHSRDNKLKQKESTVNELLGKVHDLEVENARLRGERNLSEISQTHPREHIEQVEHHEKPRHSFLDRFRLNPSA